MEQRNNQIPKTASIDLRTIILEKLKGITLEFIETLFTEEVESLCGKPFSRKGALGLYHRAGSDPGSVIVQGQKVLVKKPRIKSFGKEINLKSYGILKDKDLLTDKIMGSMLCGVSTRNYDELLENITGGTGLSKSSVSRAFIRGSKRDLDELNSIDLSSYDFAAVMVDGIQFINRTVLVALGITVTGEKHVLGLRMGNSENAEVCSDFLINLKNRGLPISTPLLFVIDGGRALKKAIKNIFGEHHFIQRCVRHKERNILDYLPKKYHMEFKRKWKLIHSMNSFDEALVEYKNLALWLRAINLEATKSLEESEKETLTVLKLKAHGELRKTLLSTNPIESIFDKVRMHTNRVKRWRSNADQITRWVASNLLRAEKRFQKVKGHNEMKIFIAELRKNNLQLNQDVA